MDLIYLWIILGLVVVIAIAVVLYFTAFRSSRYEKKFRNIKAKYENTHNQFENQMLNDLKRIDSIAKENPDYQNINQEIIKQYNDIAKIFDKNCKDQLDKTQKFLEVKNYKDFVENADNTNYYIGTFQEKFNELNKKISSIITKDDENNHAIIQYRQKYRAVKEHYENKQNELRFVSSSYEKVFSKLEDMLNEADNNLRIAHYEEAKSHYPEIDSVLTKIDSTLETMPKLVTLSYIVIPDNIKNVTELFDKLTNENYPLQHIPFTKTINTLKDELAQIQENLVQFKTKNAETSLLAMKDALLQFENAFNDEISAKEFFNNNQENIYNTSYALENRFIKIKRHLPEYQKSYILNDNAISLIERTQNEVNELSLIKRTIDTYFHSTNQQPYTTLKTKLNECNYKIGDIEADINKIQEYLTSLKTDAENDFEFLGKQYLLLKNKESSLRQINVASLDNLIKPKFNEIYDELNEVGTTIQQLPIDISKCNNIIAHVKLQSEALLNEYKNTEEVALRSEQSLIYANQYRQEFYDVQKSLVRSENSFLESDFIRCEDNNIAIIKKFTSTQDNQNSNN